MNTDSGSNTPGERPCENRDCPDHAELLALRDLVRTMFKEEILTLSKVVQWADIDLLRDGAECCGWSTPLTGQQQAALERLRDEAR